jgi:hypothetical protein
MVKCQLRTIARISIAISVAITLAHCTSATFSQEPAKERKSEEKTEKDEKKNIVFEAERALMARTVVKVLDSETGPREAKQLDHAILKYDDQVLRMAEASVWVWMDDGRPVAIQKTEVNNYWNPPGWLYCFCALSESRVEVKWPNVRRPYKSREPVEFKQFPNAKPGPKSAWKQQARGLSRQFKATMGAGNGRRQLRLVPKPLLEYESESHGILAGAVFSLAIGTNPSMFLIIELRDTDKGSQWFHGSARATSAPIQLKHSDVEVRAEGNAPRPGQFPTWTYVWLSRSPEINEATKRQKAKQD